MTTDGGSNEVGARKIALCDVKDMSHTLFIDLTCLEHSQHLVALSALKAADRALEGHRSWRYYSSLATAANVCRSIGKELFSCWCERHGYEDAKKVAKTLWPRACSGRWSGLEKPEERFIKCGEARLTPILTEILGSQSRKEASKKQSQSHASVDELAIEETKAYSQKMSKWRRKTVDCVSDKLWWETVGNMHQVRAPLSHFSNFLKKRGPENKKTWRSSHIAQLVLGRALEFRQEFSDQWRKIVDSWDGTVDDNDQDAQFARNFASLIREEGPPCLLVSSPILSSRLLLLRFTLHCFTPPSRLF